MECMKVCVTRRVTSKEHPLTCIAVLQSCRCQGFSVIALLVSQLSVVKDHDDHCSSADEHRNDRDDNGSCSIGRRSVLCMLWIPVDAHRIKMILLEFPVQSTETLACSSETSSVVRTGHCSSIERRRVHSRIDRVDSCPYQEEGGQGNLPKM